MVNTPQPNAEKSPIDKKKMTNAELMRIEMIHSHANDKDETARNIVLERSRKLAITASFVFVIYYSVVLIAYVVVDHKFKTKEGITDVERWKDNYEKSCGEKMDLNSSL